jgi:hypothetical protein
MTSGTASPFRVFAAAVAAAALSAVAPSPAKADNFRFGFGYRSGPPAHFHHHHRHRHHRHHHHFRSFYGPPVVLVPRPPVIYAPPPVVYAPASPPLRIVPSSRPAYRTADGRYCREYQATIAVGGEYQPAYGTACQGPDGSWRIVD